MNRSGALILTGRSIKVLATMRTVVFLAFCATGFGQVSGSIAGNVLDLPGDKVAGAPVVATNTATKIAYRGASSKQGDYSIESLPAGTYDVSVNLLGFNPF